MPIPTHAALLRPVTDAERAAYQRDGVVCLKQIYPADWLALLTEAMDQIFDPGRNDRDALQGVFKGDSEQGSRSDMVLAATQSRSLDQTFVPAMEGDPAQPVTGRSVVETDAAHWNSHLKAHHISGPLPDLIHQLTGSQQIFLYSDQLFLKEPGSRLKTPFHQDKPYFLVDQGDVAVAWVPADVVTRDNGAMGYVRGSHLWGRTFIPSDFQTEFGTFPQLEDMSFDGLEPLTPDLVAPEHITYFDAEPGDVIVHHWATLHGSRGNTSASRTRRAASVRFACEGCRFYRRPSSPEPFRKTLRLADGAPLEQAERFPVVWPRQSG